MPLADLPWAVLKLKVFFQSGGLQFWKRCGVGSVTLGKHLQMFVLVAQFAAGNMFALARLASLHHCLCSFSDCQQICPERRDRISKQASAALQSSHCNPHNRGRQLLQL